MKHIIFAGLALLFLCPKVASAHDVPDDVRIKIFMKPENQKMRILVRMPANALIDILFPTLPDSSWLDLREIDGFALEGAKVWIADLLSIREADNLLSTPQVIAVRVSRANDASFSTFPQAMQHVNGDRLPLDTLLSQDQAVVDALLETPIQSDRSAFYFEPRFARVGVLVTTNLAFLSAGDQARIFEYEGDPEPFALSPGWKDALGRLFQEGFSHFWNEADYLLFALCVALVFKELRSSLSFVAAFVAAQSFALIGSAFGMKFSMPWTSLLWGVLIEAAIVFMAIEAIVAGDSTDKRYEIGLATGLVFGSGQWFGLEPTIQFGGLHRLESAVAFEAGILICCLFSLAVFVIAMKCLLRFCGVPSVAVILVAAIVVRISWHRMLDRAHALSLVPIKLPEADFRTLAIIGIPALAIMLMATAYRSRRTLTVP
jgi:hypothetical protein